MTKTPKVKKNGERNLYAIAKKICARNYKIRQQANKKYSKPKDQDIVDMMVQCNLNNG